MKKLFITIVLISLFGMLSIFPSPVLANDGEMKVKLSGVSFVDESDNLGVNQETYNTYEGFGFSIYDFSYDTDFGVGFNADLENITLNNRNLRFNTYKPGLFNLSLFNNQYRRTYDDKGEFFTRKQASGISGFVKPAKEVKIFGGFNYDEKHGKSTSIYRPIADTLELSTDYTHYSYNFGADLFFNYGKIEFEYKDQSYQDDLNFSNDRNAQQYNISFYTSIPDYEKLKLFGGYFNRVDELDSNTTKLESNTYWLASRIYLEQQWELEYQIIKSNSDHSSVREVDNAKHTFSLTKNWNGLGGLSFGYTAFSSDNDIEKTSSNGLVLRGWYKYQNKLYIKSKYSFVNKDVDDGSTIYGKEERSHSNLSVKYTANEWSTFKGKLDMRVKEYKELDSKVDYTTLSGGIYLKRKGLGKLSFTVAYYVGEFKNRSDRVNYEFSDHVLNANVSPDIYDRVNVWAGATYYRSQRDIDVEKFNLNCGFSWEFIKSHHVAAKYNVYTFDDLMMANDTYTANIIEVSLIKDLKL